MPSTSLTPNSRWPHRWAILLACATFPLVWWGGFVTATGSGMAFRDWLTSDGVLMPLYPWFSAAKDKFIEHGHRVLAQGAGLLTIALVIVCWRCESRRWVRNFSLALFAGVLLQGILGGLRVVLDERVLALLHGCVGPLFFVATVVMAVVTSDGWAITQQEATPAIAKLFHVAVLTAALAYLQLVLGAVVRHSPHMLGENAGNIFKVAVYFHVIMAAAVLAHVLLLAVRCWRTRVTRGVGLTLASLIVVQLLLGASSWIVRYGMPGWATAWIGETGHFNRASDFASASILAAHGAVGSLIIALTAIVAVYAGRRRYSHVASTSTSAATLRRVLA
jgi:cytochrome c oxidase assembly protein subunit 15